MVGKKRLIERKSILKKYPIKSNIGFESWKVIFSFLSDHVYIFSQLCLVQKDWTLSKLCHLIKLNISSNNLQFLAKIPNIRHLTIVLWKSDHVYDDQHHKHFCFINKPQITSMFQKYVFLKSIEITSFCKLDMTNFLRCYNLKLEYCNHIILPPNLESLIIESCENISFLSSRLCKLYSFSLEMCAKITNHNLLLFQYFENLTELALLNCTKITDVSNLRYCLKLRYLEIDSYTGKLIGLQLLSQINTLVITNIENLDTSETCELRNITTLVIGNCEKDQDCSFLNNMCALQKIVFTQYNDKFVYTGIVPHEFDYDGSTWFVTNRIKKRI